MTKSYVIFIGPFPPPVHGQAESTRFIFEHLRRASLDLVKVNTAGVIGRGKVVEMISRTFVHLRAALLIVHSRVVRRAACTVYISINANIGMYLSAFLALVARGSGCQLVFHHHASSHIHDFTFAMWLLANFAGTSAVHITVCEIMGIKLAQLYNKASRFMPLSNVILLPDEPAPEHAPQAGIRLGHLSNLTVEKGLDTCIALVKDLRAANLPVQLTIAGPPANKSAQLLLAAAKRELGDAFEYRGAVYGSQKARFYQDIDVFLFPSRYKNETQGIVTLEALASSVPVVAYGRWCIASDLADSGSLPIDPADDFVRVAGARVRSWLDDPDAFTTARHQTGRRYRALKREGERELERFTALMASRPAPRTNVNPEIARENEEPE